MWIIIKMANSSKVDTMLDSYTESDPPTKPGLPVTIKQLSDSIFLHIPQVDDLSLLVVFYFVILERVFSTK